jgi:predicted NBD/HSP70 family sugar kinase
MSDQADETKAADSVEPIYDFSDWGCGIETLEETLSEEIRRNLRAAFEEFAKGKWHCAISQGDECGAALEWCSDHYDQGDMQQPAWIVITPFQLAEGLLRATRCLDPQDVLVVGLPLWRQALEHVEAELRRKIEVPAAKDGG